MKHIYQKTLFVMTILLFNSNNLLQPPKATFSFNQAQEIWHQQSIENERFCKTNFINNLELVNKFLFKYLNTNRNVKITGSIGQSFWKTRPILIHNLFVVKILSVNQKNSLGVAEYIWNINGQIYKVNNIRNPYAGFELIREQDIIIPRGEYEILVPLVNDRNETLFLDVVNEDLYFNIICPFQRHVFTGLFNLFGADVDLSYE